VNKQIPSAPPVKFITLGCRVNQYETQAMREALAQAAVEGDFVIINTCTVTSEADRESRYWIRRARRENPKARIVVTGCGVERDRKEIESLPEADLVLSNRDKVNIAERLMQGCASPAAQDAAGIFSPLTISSSEGRTRAFVKIQDGCNHACAFCKVVMVRGRSRSRPLRDIVEELKRLSDSGYREVVFAGIQLGAYGLDPLTLPSPPRGEGKGEGNGRLEDVLEACSKIEGIERLRLSSIEPADVRPELIRALREILKCCPHLHIPLQSGDDEILMRMNRRYRRGFYLDLIGRLRSELPDFCLTLDVMAGFPGETGEHFENTLRLLEEVRPAGCHVFPYSRREGTRAARLADLPAPVISGRVKALKAFAARMGEGVRRSFLGRTLPVLVENRNAAGQWQGHTPNFIKVYFETDAAEDWEGRIVEVMLAAVSKDGVRTYGVAARRAATAP